MANVFIMGLSWLLRGLLFGKQNERTKRLFATPRGNAIDDLVRGQHGTETLQNKPTVAVFMIHGSLGCEVLDF